MAGEVEVSKLGLIQVTAGIPRYIDVVHQEPVTYYVIEEKPRSVARSLFSGVWGVLRYVLYMLLMLLRTPVQMLGHLLFFPSVGCGVFYGFVMGWKSQPFMWLTGVGIGLWMLGFLFDTLLLWVSPEELYLKS